MLLFAIEITSVVTLVATVQYHNGDISLFFNKDLPSKEAIKVGPIEKREGFIEA